MLKWMVWFPLRLLRGGLSLLGLATLVLAAMLATPLARLPELSSVSQAARAVDRSSMPDLERFSARDGTNLAYRHYPARGPASDKIAILVHGSSGSSLAVHALAEALAARGVETYAPDIRGHGGSGTRGDIGYLGQLENDLEDLVAVVRKTAPSQPLTLLGHSAGGGFALRVASSPIQNLFARTVLLAPYLGYDAPTNRPGSGGWASPTFRASWRWRPCTGSVSNAARRCRRWLSRCRRIPNGSSPPAATRPISPPRPSRSR
jgi:alpha-beta hydrolase superfamily lysophospholipase